VPCLQSLENKQFSHLHLAHLHIPTDINQVQLIYCSRPHAHYDLFQYLNQASFLKPTAPQKSTSYFEYLTYWSDMCTYMPKFSPFHT